MMGHPIIMGCPTVSLAVVVYFVHLKIPTLKIPLSLFFPPYNQSNLVLESPSRWFLDLFDVLNPVVASVLSYHRWLGLR